MFATDSKPPQNEVLKVWHLITLLKLSGPAGIRAHIKTIKTIRKRFHKSSQRSSRYTVHTIKLFIQSLGAALFDKRKKAETNYFLSYQVVGQFNNDNWFPYAQSACMHAKYKYRNIISSILTFQVS